MGDVSPLIFSIGGERDILDSLEEREDIFCLCCYGNTVALLWQHTTFRVIHQRGER